MNRKAKAQPLDLTVTPGKPAGPYRHQLTRRNGTILDLTGCTVRGAVYRQDEDGTAVPMFELDTALAHDPADGYYDFGIADIRSATLVDPEATYRWFSEVVMPTGEVIPLHSGTIDLQI